MKSNKKAPSKARPKPEAINSKSEQHKGKKNISNSKYLRALNFFLDGGKYTVIQLTEALQISDPRSLIRRLRNKKVPINAYWEKSGYSRYKVYFLAGCIQKKPND